MNPLTLIDILSDIKNCRLCETSLDPNPVIRVKPNAKLLIVGQAPGRRVHETGIPWNDASGKRLRNWLNMTETEFYEEQNVAILPSAFCYPGRGDQGDLPPPKICAQTWHQSLLEHLRNRKLTLLVGIYAQSLYLNTVAKKTLTDTVKAYEDYLIQGYFPLPHPSPRNFAWLAKNPWFEETVLPRLRHELERIGM